jgi:hypothetical protein
MKTSKSFALITSIVMISLSTACGTKSDESKDTAANQNTPAELGLPEAAVIAVPVDRNGQELPGQADLRILPNGQESLAGQAIQAAYETGRQPDYVMDEMDDTTSTESFQGWGNYRRIGQPGYGYGYNQYQPIYYHGGNPYQWRFLNQHRCRNVNYYYYHRRPQPWGNPWNQPTPVGYGHGNYGNYGNYGSYGNYGNYGHYGQIQPIGYR